MDAKVLDGCRVNPRDVAFFFPPNLTKTFAQKVKLFVRVADYIEQLGGRVIRGDYAAVNNLPDEIIPIIGCTPQFKDYIVEWRKRGRTWIYWDRGYFRRGYYITWMPKGIDGGYYRWHINRPQMDQIYDVPADRWKALKLDDQIRPWNKNGKHIVVIDTPSDYWNLFGHPRWIVETVETIKRHTDRPVVVRDKESRTPLYDELKDAHCLVAHGSNAAIESVVFGCPVFVDQLSAAAIVGQTDFSKIETPVYPDRQPWLNSLAYCQFNEQEIVNGTLWRMIR